MTLARQVHYLLTALIMLALFAAILVAEGFSHSGLFWVYVLGGASIVFFLPLFILFFKYYALNKGLVIVYDSDSGWITIKNKKLRTEATFSLDDIKYVFYTQSGSGKMAWNDYYFSEIYLRDGRKFIITCLMSPQLKWPVAERYESFTVYYPYPKGW